MGNKSKHYLNWLLIFLAHLSLLGGCTRKKEKAEHQNLQKKIKEEKVLRLNFQAGDPFSLLPHDMATCLRDIILGEMLFEGISRFDPQGNYELAGAEKVEISPCKKRYTFTLRANNYSDGSPVVAYDYERAWKRAVAPDSKCEKTYLFYCIKNAEAIKKGNCPLSELGVKALSDTQLFVELTTPTPHFLELLAFISFVPFKEKNGEILGSGPYVVDQWKRGRFLELTSNPHFWDKNHLKIKKIKILLVQDAMTAFHMKEKGEIDWIGDPFSPIPEDLLVLETEQNKLSRVTVNCPFWLYFNTESFPLSSPLIRQALNYAVDRRTIAKHIFFGSDPLFTPLPGSLTLCEEARCDYDLAKARELLEEGMKELGLTRETFPPITINSSIGKRKNLAAYLQESWQTTLGIDVKIDTQEWNVFVNSLVGGQYQVAGVFIASDYNSPLSYLERLTNPQNFARWKNPRFIELVSQAKQETDSEVRLKLLRQAERILKDESPVVSLITQSLNYAYAPELKGVVFSPTGTVDLRWAYFEDKESIEAEEKSTPPS